jgi:cold shock CspA family protein
VTLATFKGSITTLFAALQTGFILGDDGDEIFFDHSALSSVAFEKLRIGQRVSYQVQLGLVGPRAVALQTLDAEPAPSQAYWAKGGSV